MGFVSAIKSFLPLRRTAGSELDTIEINIPQSIYIKELAVYAATSLIANAISQSEIKVYVGNKAVKNSEYFSLNIKPNPNESASEFWHKVAEKILRAEPGKGAFCFESSGNIYCADDYVVEEKRPFLGNIYSGVIVDNFQLDKKFSAYQCFIFKLENEAVNRLITGMYSEYGKIVSAAMDSYKETNVSKYILNIEGVKAGDAEFNAEFEKFLKKPIEKFITGDAKVYVQYDGRKLEQQKKEAQQKNSDDVVKLLEEMFKVAGKAYKIPESLMTGNITNVNDVVKTFLTFAVDPITDMIGKVLTGQYGYGEFVKGNYYKVDTSGVNHIDIFDMADKIDKLISSSFACIDEVREKAGLDAINEDWSKKHLLTKNYEFIEKMLKERGETE